MRRYNHGLSRLSGLLRAAIALGVLASTYAMAGAGATTFQWTSTAPVILPQPDATHDSLAVKDPSVVYANGKYHVFMTTSDSKGWHIAYTSFKDWPEASAAPVTYLERSAIGPGYRAAPQVFYFSPQHLWYLIFQGGDPMYSTTSNIDDPLSWSAAQPFFGKIPEQTKKVLGKNSWLDFWIICDEKKCYLFNSDDGGQLYRSETTIGQFPKGFTNTAIALQDSRDKLFEASMTYKVAGTGTYITMVEAMGPKGRYFRSWTSDRLDGAWTPLADSLENPFAGADNVNFDGPAWSEGISHGELVRAGYDQTLTVDFCKPLQFLYQGVAPNSGAKEYYQLPYRLGLLTATRQPVLNSGCAKQAN